MRLSVALLTALMLQTCHFAPVYAAPPSTLLMERLADLNAWVRLNTPYRARHLPKIVTRTEEDMARIHFGESFRPDLVGWVRAQAMSGIIFLPPDIKTDGSEDYVLVHELTHFQQFEAGLSEIPSCEREREAYEIQDKFVQQTGRGEKSDPMTVLLVVNSCNAQ